MMDDIITNYHQTSNKIQLNTTLITAMIGWGDKMQILDSGSDYLESSSFRPIENFFVKERGMVMMENLTHVENWNLNKGQKLVGIKI